MLHYYYFVMVTIPTFNQQMKESCTLNYKAHNCSSDVLIYGWPIYNFVFLIYDLQSED